MSMNLGTPIRTESLSFPEALNPRPRNCHKLPPEMRQFQSVKGLQDYEILNLNIISAERTHQDASTISKSHKPKPYLRIALCTDVTH